MIDTPGKLLDAAEKLFATQGYSAVSLRQIIAEAEVNIAAVHYHFGSKEDLLDKVVMRRAGPVNDERIARLDKILAESGDAAPELAKILEAFLAPIAAVARNHPEFARMMGRIQSEGVLTGVIERNFQPMFGRFLSLLRRATPGISDFEFRWRVHFAQGALAFAMSEPPRRIAGPMDDDGFEPRIERLIAFLSGGFAAPAAANDAPAKQSGENS